MPNLPVRYRVWVGGLPPDIQKEDLFAKFSKFGCVRDIVVRTSERDTYAFLTYPEKEEAEEAIARMDRSCIWGAPVKVNISKDFAPTGPRQRGPEGKPLDVPVERRQLGLPPPVGWRAPAQRSRSARSRQSESSASRSPQGNRPRRSRSPRANRHHAGKQQRGMTVEEKAAMDDRGRNEVKSLQPAPRSAPCRGTVCSGRCGIPGRCGLPLPRDPAAFRALWPSPTRRSMLALPSRNCSFSPGPLPTTEQEEGEDFLFDRQGRPHSPRRPPSRALPQVSPPGGSDSCVPPAGPRTPVPESLRRDSRPSCGHQVTLENIPDDMSWEELKDLGKQYGVSVTFARTFRRGSTFVGVLEFSDPVDSKHCAQKLNGRRMEDGSSAMRVYEGEMWSA